MLVDQEGGQKTLNMSLSNISGIGNPGQSDQINMFMKDKIKFLSDKLEKSSKELEEKEAFIKILE